MALLTIDDWMISLSAALFDSLNKDARVCEAEVIVGTKYFKTDYNLAVALYATHLLQLDSQGSGTDTNPNGVGVIAEEREDRVAIKYRTGSSTDSTNEEWLKLTNWGARYLVLRNKYKLTFVHRRMGC